MVYAVPPADNGAERSRVVAVVVTFNRLALLQRLLATLRDTTRLDEILIVDNASTDGTTEWLASRPWDQLVETKVPVHVEHLGRNSGGAGGFHAGLEVALERGADLAWLMDDDGMPQPDCLDLLLKESDLDFWGPLVVDEAATGRLVFPIRLPGRTRVVDNLADAEAVATAGRIDGIVIPFNGVLVSAELVKEIGLPREEFFIWGDDHEYRMRAEKAGARVATIVGARVHHPSIGALGTPTMFGSTTYNHSPSNLKHYCMARNNLVNLREYRTPAHALAFAVKTAWFYTFTRTSPSRLRLSCEAMWAGLRGDFTGHRRFLS